MRPLRPALLLLAPLLLQTATATTVFRCEGSDGRVIFSQYGCASDQRELSQESANPPPGGDTLLPAAAPPARQTTPRTRRPQSPSRKRSEKSADLVVVGEKDDGCGNRVVGSELRKAIIEGKVKAGMPRAAVESALGRPDVVRQQNGYVHYRYRSNGRHGARSVSFDENGCVRGRK